MIYLYKAKKLNESLQFFVWGNSNSIDNINLQLIKTDLSQTEKHS